MKRRVLIRADGSSEIGLGHLVRCISFAHMLQVEYAVMIVCIEIPGQLVTEIETSGFKLCVVENETTFFDMICSEDIVVLDGYNFDLTYQKKIKQLSYKLICIDDLHEHSFVADLIINQAPGVVESDYNAAPNTHFALGLDYALLRPVFLKQASINRKIVEVKTILICFGGADEINLTEKIVRDILELGRFKEIIVITGTSYKHLSGLNNVISCYNNVTHIHQADGSEMLNSMLKADMAIVPASGTLVEVMAAGCIALSGYYIDNQMNIYKGYKKLNAILDAGDFRNLDVSQVFKNINIVKRKQIIDGKSGYRILEKIRLL